MRLWHRYPNPLVRFIVLPLYVMFIGPYVLIWWLLIVACLVPIILLAIVLPRLRIGIGFGVLFGGD